MEGYIASHGIFLVINNTNSKKIAEIKESFGKIKNVSVVCINCYKTSTTKKKHKVKKNKPKKASEKIKKVKSPRKIKK